MKFSHLHVHTHYSLLDGLSKVDELVEYVKELGMDSVAITDHGVLYGAVEFYKEAKKQGIKPIIGCEMYMAYKGMEQKRPNIDDKRYHLVLLVKNEEGYENLVKLITKAHLEGFYYKPRIDEELLAKHSEGLIGLSACVEGKIPQLIIADKYEEAKKAALKYQEILGKDDFYLEIQHHPNIEKQKIANKGIIKLSKELDIPLVATNDSHYLRPEDAEAQDILMVINTGDDIDNPDRLTMQDDDYSLRSPKKMIEDFKDHPEAIKNTQEIVEKCNFEFKLGDIRLPAFETPNGKTAEEYLRELCLEGIKEHYGENPDQEVMDRLNYELKIIEEMGFSAYFLIVQDFVKWAREQRIVVGPGRGSAGGSLVAYTTGITTIDPIKWDLLFERFLNPARVSMPDIDLDFTDRRRDEVMEYVAEKYGRNHVAQICTFGTMAARGSIRDVGRSLGYSYDFCDKIAKMIPMGDSLDEALDKVSELERLYNTRPKVKKLIDLSKKLEGVNRHISTHACAVVIAKEPLDDTVPLQHPSQSKDEIITQYEMHSAEDLGLLKMDFLGLKNLTIIEDTLSRIYAVHHKNVDINNIPLDDEKTYDLLQKGNTVGVFQLESGGFRKYLKQLEPTSLEDIIVMIALYRPGPMSFIPEYIGRKKGERKVKYIHPKLKNILDKTYGLPVYQEDLMKIAQELAGFSLAEADILRKAIGKKIRSLLMKQKKKLIKGMRDNGISKEVAQKIWEWILPFARYGFNRCLTGDTEIIDADTGKKLTIKEISDNEKYPTVFSLGKDLKLKKSPITDVFKNGKKPVYKIETQLGKEIKATLNHPFLTKNGWKKLENIKSGSKVALIKEDFFDKKDKEEKSNSSDIRWDEIVNIEPAGKEETYDLTIKDTHNFLANDFIVHNSHSCAYAFIAYQTAYLKANYPIEFMSALLTSEKSDIERVGELIKECEDMELEVLPPDINESWRNFTVVPDSNKIRFGLTAVKNVGDKIVESIIQEREDNGLFKSMSDFAARVKPKDLNKRALESLIKAGAFDQFKERNLLLKNIPTLKERSREVAKKERTGQKGLFSGTQFDKKVKFQSAEPATEEQKLLWEKELLGLFISSHPLHNVDQVLDKKTVDISELASLRSNRATVGGIILNVKRIVTKKSKKPMCFVTLEDLTGRTELVVFPSVMKKYNDLLKENNIILVSGKIDERDNKPKILCSKIKKIQEA